MQRRIVGALMAVGVSLTYVVTEPAAAQGQEVLKLEVNNFPRYGTMPAGAQQDQMKASAEDLAREASAGRKLWVFVIGHADFDAKGREFEKGVSRERARNARLIYEGYYIMAASSLKLNSEQTGAVEFHDIGVGTCCPIKLRPINESERRLNRRVMIWWAPQHNLLDGQSMGRAIADRIAARN